jgi:hypothetical protein
MQQSLGAEQFAVSNKAYSCVHWNSHAEATHFFATAFPRVARFIVPSVSGSFLYTNRVLEKLARLPRNTILDSPQSKSLPTRQSTVQVPTSCRNYYSKLHNETKTGRLTLKAFQEKGLCVDMRFLVMLHSKHAC